MTKKLCVLMLVIAVLLAGCGGGSDATPSSSTVSSLSSESASSTQESSQASEAPKNMPNLERGTWNGEVYTNNYLGLTFTLGNQWAAATDEEIAMTAGLSLELLDDSGIRFSEEVLEMLNHYDMLAVNMTTGTNVMVMYENLSLAIGAARVSEEEYLGILTQQLEAMNTGYTTMELMADTTKIGDVDYYGLVADSLMNMQQLYFVNKQDTYMRVIIISLFEGDKLEDVLKMFS